MDRFFPRQSPSSVSGLTRRENCGPIQTAAAPEGSVSPRRADALVLVLAPSTVRLVVQDALP